MDKIERSGGAEVLIPIDSDSEARSFFGKHDENLRALEKSLGVSLSFKSGMLKVRGAEVEVLSGAEKVVNDMLAVVRKGGCFTPGEIVRTLRAYGADNGFSDIFTDHIEVSSKKAHVKPRSAGQKQYIDAIRKNDIVFAIGPAGTGKTYLAMAMAVNALRKNLVSRIILTRPAVAAGESLGFLPGDMYEKVNPYLRPLYDALYDMMDAHMIKDHIAEGIIEVAPLAYMRGRTLNDSFIIMDEAQNSTPEQMKMFLTRLGFDSKTVITGDVTQSDLPRGKTSGLLHARGLLDRIPGIKFAFLKGEDVVRHELVQKIIEVYKREGDGQGERHSRDDTQNI
jgi:phosphate starvation-inducible protein PhoH and related proteins